MRAKHLEKVDVLRYHDGNDGNDALDAVSRYQKGPIFSFGLSGRDPIGKQKIPGPGAYELAQEKLRRNGPGKSKTAFFSFQ